MWTERTLWRAKSSAQMLWRAILGEYLLALKLRKCPMSEKSTTHASGAPRETRSHIWEIRMDVPVITNARVTFLSCKACLETQANSHCSSCKAVIVDSMRIILSNRLQTSTFKPDSVSYVKAQYIPFTHDLVRPTIRVEVLVQCSQTGMSRIRHWVGEEAEIRPISGYIQTCEAYTQSLERGKNMNWVSITFGTMKTHGGKRRASAVSAASRPSQVKSCKS